MAVITMVAAIEAMRYWQHRTRLPASCKLSQTNINTNDATHNGNEHNHVGMVLILSARAAHFELLCDGPNIVAGTKEAPHRS